MNTCVCFIARCAVVALVSLTARAAELPALQRRSDLPPLAYTNADARIPNYPAGQKWGTLGEPTRQMQLPLSPSESALHLVTQGEFTHQLWAAEPDIAKPICMAFDERGRLWIAETVDYPNDQQEPGQGHDRIRICEDTDGDGRADKFTIFAEKLSIPTAMVFANGGLIVIEGGRTLFLRDYDNDGKADEREVLFEGWGMKDTHATASNLRYGLDNWIWGTVGYSGFEGTVKQKHIKFGQGVFRFKPDGSALEFIKSSNNNTWGLGFTEEGFVFGSTANNNASWYMAIPNRYYEAVAGWSASRMETIADSQLIYPITEHVRQVDAHGRYTAGAGHAFYTARNFPSSYWNKVAFVAEPTGHLVGQFRLEERGTDFAAVNEHSFVASDDEWTAPIAAEVGPDGAVWVLDWYNYIVQHNPTPTGFSTGKGNAYDTPLRDKSRGRVYRVAWDKATPVPKMNLAKATSEQLVSTLYNDNQLWRLHAQRIMIERGRRDVVPSLFAMVRDTRVDELGMNLSALHALWTLQGLGQRDPNDRSLQNVIIGALRHPSASVRRAAAMVLPRNSACLSALLAAGSLLDPDPQVRLAAFLALSEMPSSDEGGAAVFAALQQNVNVRDRWIPDAATAAAARHDAAFLKTVLASGTSPSPELSIIIRNVTGNYAQRGPVESVLPTLLALNNAAPGVAQPLLDGLAAKWPKEKIPAFSPADETKIGSLLETLPDDARSSLLALADHWGKKSIFIAELNAVTKTLREQIGNSASPDDQRIDSARRLITLVDEPESVNIILEQVTPLTPPALSGAFLGVLGRSRNPRTASAIIARFDGFTPSTRRAAVAELLRRPEWASALLTSIEKKNLQRADIAADHWSQLKSYPDGAVVVKARELEKVVGGASSADMETVIRKLLPVARQKGDAVQGKEVFNKNCAVCHQFDGQGAAIGPDLNGIAVRSRQDILIDILDPNRSVETNYRLWTVSTKGGENYSGRLDSETATAVEVLDTTGLKHVVQRAEISEMKASNLSIMPAGFDKLPETDLAALLEYLTTTPPKAAQ